MARGTSCPLFNAGYTGLQTGLEGAVRSTCNFIILRQRLTMPRKAEFTERYVSLRGINVKRLRSETFVHYGVLVTYARSFDRTTRWMRDS